MKNQLSIISHPELGQIKSLMVNDEPWFVAKDVCELLGIAKHRDAVFRMDPDERGSVVVDTLGGKQEMATINESGLYNLIFQSRKPEAKQFRKWVTSEVLPAIRRQGFYVHPSAVLSKKETQMLQRLMRENVKRYIVNEDIRRCARRLNQEEIAVERVLSGSIIDNDVMLDLQTRALSNQQKWHNAYSVERMREVTEQLSKVPKK